MDESSKLLLTVAIPTVTVLVGILAIIASWINWTAT